ncbi:MAG: S-layer homology domain-containing protein [Chloroflexota bacterium]|nr:S-layer homology domain-containing protein [Chloroflexota bacterium]
MTRALKNPSHVALLCLALTALIALGANEAATGAAVTQISSALPRQTFTDVPTSNPFWVYIERITVRGAMPGFPCGGFREPCDPQRQPYFRPIGHMTLGELAEDISTIHHYNETTRDQTFADVPPGTPHYRALEQLGHRFILPGVTCGGPGLPCDSELRPYAQPDQVVDRYTLASVLAASRVDDKEPVGQSFSDVRPGSFYYPAVQQMAMVGIFAGYPCGRPDEPCDAYYLPYFRGLDAADRQQIAKALSIARGYSEFPSRPAEADPSPTPKADGAGLIKGSLNRPVEAGR